MYATQEKVELVIEVDQAIEKIMEREVWEDEEKVTEKGP